jgi:hypothetical protein
MKAIQYCAFGSHEENKFGDLLDRCRCSALRKAPATTLNTHMSPSAAPCNDLDMTPETQLAARRKSALLS